MSSVPPKKYGTGILNNVCAMLPSNITEKVDGHLFNPFGVMLNLYRLETPKTRSKKGPKASPDPDRYVSTSVSSESMQAVVIAIVPTQTKHR